MEGGLLDGIEPFRIGTSDLLRRHVMVQTQTAIDQGFRDFVDSVITLLFSVTYESHNLRAADVTNEMYKLARILLTVRSGHYPELADSLVERVWRAEISACEDAARDVERDVPSRPLPLNESVARLKTEFRHTLSP